MRWSVQLHYIPVTIFLKTDLFLDRISQKWNSRGVCHDQSQDKFAGPELSFFHKRKGILKK